MPDYVSCNSFTSHALRITQKVTDCRMEQVESFVHQQTLQMNYVSFAHEITTWTGDILWQKSQVQWSVSTYRI